MVEIIRINELLHLSLRDIEEHLKTGNCTLDLYGMLRRDRRIIKKGAPEYGIYRWELLVRTGGNSYILNAYRLNRRTRGEYRFFSLVFDQDFEIIYLVVDYFGSESWDRYELDKTLTIADYIEEATG